MFQKEFMSCDGALPVSSPASSSSACALATTSESLPRRLASSSARSARSRSSPAVSGSAHWAMPTEAVTGMPRSPKAWPVCATHVRRRSAASRPPSSSVSGNSSTNSSPP